MEIKDLSHLKGLAILDNFEVEEKFLGDFLDLNGPSNISYEMKSLRMKKDSIIVESAYEEYYKGDCLFKDIRVIVPDIFQIKNIKVFEEVKFIDSLNKFLKENIKNYTLQIDYSKEPSKIYKGYTKGNIEVSFKESSSNEIYFNGSYLMVNYGLICLDDQFIIKTLGRCLYKNRDVQILKNLQHIKDFDYEIGGSKYISKIEILGRTLNFITE